LLHTYIYIYLYIYIHTQMIWIKPRSKIIATHFPFLGTTHTWLYVALHYGSIGVCIFIYSTFMYHDIAYMSVCTYVFLTSSLNISGLW
jgi:hypothetical protein